MDWTWLIWVAVAYLAGSVPFGLLIGLARGVDVRKAGSGNLGTTNVGRWSGGGGGFCASCWMCSRGRCRWSAQGSRWGISGRPSHTRWGWENDVEPGTYSLDPEESAASFRRLGEFAVAHPSVEVRVGHQH